MAGIIDSFNMILFVYVVYHILGNECSPAIMLKHHLYHCEIREPMLT